MEILTISDLTKTYGAKTLFKDVSFLIHPGDRIGLIGPNGTGKTNLLNAIAGKAPVDSGSVTKSPKNYRISYLMQLPQFDPQLSIIDAVFQGDNPMFKVIKAYEQALNDYTQHPDDPKVTARYTKLSDQMTQAEAWNAETDVKTILTKLHLNDWNKPVGQLSGGQQKRVGLAQALLTPADLLMLDEPTNHLDFDSIAWLEDYLSKYPGAILVVTHDRYFLDQVANQIFELDHGHLHTYPGNYEKYVEQRAARIETEQAIVHKQQRLYQQELEWMRKTLKGHKGRKPQGRKNQFHELENSLKEVPKASTELDLNIGQQRLGKKVIELKQVNLSFGQHAILRDFNWLIQAGKRYGITGLNGAGKTTLLNVITRQQPVDSGEVIIGETVRLGYYTQMNEEDMDPDKRLIKYIQEAGHEVIAKNGEHISATQLLEQFEFPRNTHGTHIGQLSGGEKRRLYLLKILMQQPNVLLLDEPTNDLDIGTLTILENYLRNFNGTVITVSHDRYFLNKVAPQLLIFDGNAQIERYTGIFTDYLHQQQDHHNDHHPANKVTKPVATKANQSKARKLTYAQKLEFEKLEPAIDDLEQQIATIKQQMLGNSDDYQKLVEQQQQLDELNQQLDTKMQRWEELSELM